MFDERRYNVVQESKTKAVFFVQWIMERDPEGFLNTTNSEIFFTMKAKWGKCDWIDWRVTGREIIRLRNEYRWERNHGV